MDPEKTSMTGDPNQKSPPSVFGFVAYPQNSSNWESTFRQGQYPPGNMFHLDGFQAGTSYVPPAQVSDFSAVLTPQIGSAGVGAAEQQPTNSMFSPVQEVSAGNFNFGTAQRPQDSIVQFPFQITSDSFGSRTFTPTRGKRKTDSPTLQPCKQHITEEKMAEHMSKLHISSETAANDMESDSVREKRLYMCEEMRKLQTEPIVPQCLLSRIESPCKALVLWKPPAPLLPSFGVDKQNDTENNNEDGAPDGYVAGESEMENEIGNNMDMDTAQKKSCDLPDIKNENA